MPRKRDTVQIKNPVTQLDDKILEREQFFQFACEQFRLHGTLVDDLQVQAVLPTLCQVDFFKRSCPENMTLEEFVLSCIPRLSYEEFGRGKCVFHLGEQGDKFYIILSGRAGILVPKDLQKIEQEEEEIEQTQQFKQRASLYGGDQTPHAETFESVQRRVIKRSAKQPHLKEIELALLQSEKIDQYFTEGHAFRYQQVATSYAGLSFGDMALTTDKPRTATILALTDLQVVSLNKTGYKKVFERQIQLMNFKIDFFMRLYPAVTRFNMSKYVLYFKEFQLPQNAIVWKEGDPTTNFVILIQGEAQLEKTVESKHTATLKESLVGFTKRHHKTNIVVCTVGDGSVIGDDDVLEHHITRSHTCRTLQPSKFYVMAMEDFNLVRKNYPEILRAMQTQLVKSLRWVQQRIDSVLDIKNIEMRSDRIPVFIERRRVDDIEQQVPRLAEVRKHPIIRSMQLKKVTKDELVMLNQDLFATLQQNSEERGVERDFNMLKMANENIQKSLKIRVEKQYELFQPTKPKGPTPYFGTQTQTPTTILESLKQQQQLPFKRSKPVDFVTMYRLNTFSEPLEQGGLELKDSTVGEFNLSRIIHPQLKTKTYTRMRGPPNDTFMRTESLKQFTEPSTTIMPPVPIHAKTFITRPKRLKTLVTKPYMSQVDGFVIFNSSESYLRIQ